MQNNKYIANAPNMQATQHQRIAMVNQGVRSTMINFQAAPPSAPAQKKAVVEGETKIDKVKNWAGKWGVIVLALGVIGASHMNGQSTKAAPVVLPKYR